MKKIYMKPSTEVLRVKTEQVLAADSLNNNASREESVSNPDEILGNEGGSLWDDED